MNPTLWMVVSAIGGGVVVVLAVAYRRLAALRELEIAEQLLDEEYRALQPPDRNAYDERRPLE